MANTREQYDEEVDLLLVGAGIMSATLGAMLRSLEPEWSQVIYERLEGPAEESSYPFNNAGTGHSALCELIYTPEITGVSMCPRRWPSTRSSSCLDSSGRTR